jgi:uncharacterized protein YkwD
LTRKAGKNLDNWRKLEVTRCTLLTIAALSLFCIPKSYSESEADLSNLEQQVYQRINAARNDHQAPLLSWNEKVAVEAKRHAKNMVDRGFYTHEDPERGELDKRLDDSGIDWIRCAENIYRENGLSKPVEDAVKSWLQSPGHRSNMLDTDFSETGIGAAASRNGTIYIVQIFIK